MGRIGDVADLATALLLLGGGYVVYKTLKGGVGLDLGLRWPSFGGGGGPGPTLPDADPDVTLTAGEDFAAVTFTPVIPEPMITVAAHEAEIEQVENTKRELARLLESTYRTMDPKLRADIKASEELAYTARTSGWTDY